MKRYGYLFEELISFENLVRAAKKAQRGKRFKKSISQFNLKLEDELLSIQEELRNKTYQIGRYKNFLSPPVRDGTKTNGAQDQKHRFEQYQLVLRPQELFPA
ncbi:hypothetical protein HZB07_00545 [Candidatus Saganbacteria bacterium]|nr:hypothetical protein [Candidatus Saganbacteria bacterium]